MFFNHLISKLAPTLWQHLENTSTTDAATGQPPASATIVADADKLMTQTAPADSKTVSRTLVTIWIRHEPSGTAVRLELGEFHKVWEHGVTIGSDPSCTIVLFAPEVAPRHMCVFALSNHLFLEDWSIVSQKGEDVSQFRPPQTLAEKQEREVRSDIWKPFKTFSIGPFQLMFDEKFADESAESVKSIVEGFTRPA